MRAPKEMEREKGFQGQVHTCQRSTSQENRSGAKDLGVVEMGGGHRRVVTGSNSEQE